MEPTKLLYLDDSSHLTGTGTVVEILDAPDGRKMLILEQTIMYAQGGGQPYDTGRIENEHGKFAVAEVRFKEGIVYHIGEFTEGSIETGQEVTMYVDEDRRLLNCKLHSGGHLLDAALYEIDPTLIPGKGYHFPDGAYVEYSGDIPEEKREEVRAQLEKRMNEMIQEGGEVKTQLVPLEDLSKFCKHVPDYVPKDKPSRVVTVWQGIGCPCGGTHVQNVSEIGSMTVPKIKMKKGIIRVSYTVA